ncbi:MAG: carbohydrate ABC transporter permease, partial [Firmicutes bacterium]|nr:carbohydrate ABC transporter permease [Bacillota bacterium]
MTVRVSHARALVYHALVLAFGFVMVYPLLWLLASSFKGASEIFTHMTSLIPERFTLD